MDILSLNRGVWNILTSSLAFVFQQSSVLIDLSFKLFLYFTVLGLLVDAETPFIDFVISFIPSATKHGIKQSLEKNVEGVLTSQFESTIYQAVFTLVILDVFKVPYMFLYCVTAAFFRFVPCVSTLAVGFAAAVQLWLISENLLWAVALVCIYAFVDGKLSTDVYNKKLNQISSTVLGMSVFLGLYAFGIGGIIQGPLLVSVA